MNDNNTQDGPSNRVPPLAPGSVFTAYAGKMLGRWRVDSEVMKAATGEEFVWVKLDDHLSGPWRPCESMRRVWPLRLIPNTPNNAVSRDL